jgi:hypothetical protein
MLYAERLIGVTLTFFYILSHIHFIILAQSIICALEAFNRLFAKYVLFFV